MAPNTGQTKSRRQSANNKDRGDCIGCRQRKTRCNKDYPSCFPCLIYQVECHYGSATSLSWPTPASSKTVSEAEEASPSLDTLQLLTPVHTVDILPVEMTYRSPEVFYHFIQNRAMLARVTYQDEKTFNASLGLTQTDRTWFQMALCLTSSNRLLRGESEFQETYLYHRQNLLQWLNERLAAVRGPIPAAYLSMIVSMIKADSAFGDDSSVEIHVQGVLSILKARRRLVEGWKFYDGLAKRVMMIGLCLTFVLRQSRWVSNNLGLDPLIASMYTQLANEFLRPFVLTGSPHAAARTDGPILTWLCRALKELNLNKKRPGPRAKARLAGLDHKEAILWLKAASAYALTVGTVDWGEADQDNGNVIHVSDGLKKLRAWSDEIVTAWRGSGKTMTHNIAQPIWEKLQWMETDEGLETVREITMMAQSGGGIGVALLP